MAEDRWLAERLGRPVFTVRPETLRAELVEHADANPDSIYQARVPAQDVSSVAELCGAGMAVVNASLTMERETAELAGDGSHLVVRGDPDAHAGVLDVAESSFTRDRFHLDPAIPDEAANRVKRDWVENSLGGGRGNGVLVALDGDVPVGFLAMIEAADATVVDLIAVHEEHRGRGVGGELMAEFLQNAAGRRVRVGTQAANPPATRFYETLGFTLASASFDLHMHT